MFIYESMTSQDHLNQIRQAVKNHFHCYDTQLHKSYGYAVTVGFQRDIVSTTNEKIIFENYDHPLDQADQDIYLGTLEDSAETIVQAYLDTVKRYDLDTQNYQREKFIYDINHSDVVAFD